MTGIGSSCAGTVIERFGWTVVEILLFYHPAAWWISRRIRTEREDCVDQIAADASGNRIGYARALANLDELCGNPHNLAVAATCSPLRRRIQYLLSGSTCRGSRHGMLLAGTVACLVLVAVMVLLPSTQAGFSGRAIAAEPLTTPDDEAGSQAPGEETKTPTAVLVVRAGGAEEGVYDSIQKAIDAAPDGATIKIAAGTYDEKLVIAKPLTLEGAGWDKTVIRRTNGGKPWDFEAMQREMMQRFREVKTEQERADISEKYRKDMLTLKTLSVHGTKGVAIRGLCVSLPGKGPEGGLIDLPAVEFRGATAVMNDSAVIGSVGNGIHVSEGSDVQIQNCLLAAIHGTGIVAGGKDATSVKIRILDSELRNCRYAGIRLAGQNTSAKVAGGRISGAQWHGIRYDDASPRIQGNLIFDNARCGIYASGTTHALVEDNLFYRNGMDGMSCWFHNEDTIQGNSFVLNQREGLAIIGVSKATVVRNLFFDDKTAILWSASQNQVEVSPVDASRVRENLFWKNAANGASPNAGVAEQIAKLQQELKSLPQRGNSGPIPADVEKQIEELLVLLDKAPELDKQVAERVKALRKTLSQDPQTRLAQTQARIEELQKRLTETVALIGQQGNVEADPLFADVDKRDFSLKPGSPALKARIGVAKPLSFDSPWPLQPEEKAILAGDVEERTQQAAAQTISKATSSTLLSDIRQRKDPALRQRGLKRLQGMLSSEAGAQQHTSALAILGQAMTAKFDRDPFRPLVLPLLKSEDAQVRALALNCLPSLGATAEDLALIAPMVDDVSPEVRAAAGAALISIGKGKHAEQVIPALMKVLQDSDSKVATNVIRSMWGQYHSPELDVLLIELSHDDRYHGITIYHALSTMMSKSPAVCRRLIEELAEPDWNNSGRAAWGLTYGVVDEAKPIVEAGLLKALPEETNSYTLDNGLKALRNVASEKSRPYLESVLNSKMEKDETKQAAREILKTLDRRKRP